MKYTERKATMKTQKQLLEAHRLQLDERFLAKYPNGQFVLQYRGDMGLAERGEAYFVISWNPKRSTSHVRYKGISVKHNPKSQTLTHCITQNNSFGRCNNYDTLEKLLAACERKDVPTLLVEGFVERYNDRQNEGFAV